MVKFRIITDAGRCVLGFGLSRRNIELLTSGNPILVTAESMALPDLRANDVLICFGETEEMLYQELAEKGSLNIHTVVIDKRI